MGLVLYTCRDCIPSSFSFLRLIFWDKIELSFSYEKRNKINFLIRELISLFFRIDQVEVLD